MNKIAALCLIILTFPIIIGEGLAQEEGSVNVDFEGRAQKVLYSFYLPAGESSSNLPVLVCVGGLPGTEGQYAPTRTSICNTDPWKHFADTYGIATLTLGFQFVPEEWDKGESFQFPQAWSGSALLKILEILSAQYPIQSKELYLFGFSAGAQFVTRFAFMYPAITKSVTAHSAGNYDLPAESIETRFLITVGELDNQGIARVDAAREFVEKAEARGLDISLKVFPGEGHNHTALQGEISREFIGNLLKKQN